MKSYSWRIFFLFHKARKTNTLAAAIEMDEEEQTHKIFCFIAVTAQRTERREKLSLNEKKYETLKAHRGENFSRAQAELGQKVSSESSGRSSSHARTLTLHRYFQSKTLQLSSASWLLTQVTPMRHGIDEEREKLIPTSFRRWKIFSGFPSIFLRKFK